jgi:Skp family chaperone for outer membrane proteins
VKRAFWFLSALVGVGGMVYLAGQIQAQAPAGGGAPPAAARPAGGKVAVFNVAKVMRDYKKWQHFAKIMQDKRNAAAGELGKLRNEIVSLQEQIQKEPIKQKQEELAKVVVAKQREFEDKEKGVRQALDTESSGYLQQLFAEVQQCVKAIVDTNGYDVVFAYPDAITEEEMRSPLYYDLKMRPPAAMPFYVSPSADVTGVLVETLNKYFPPPAGAVQPAGGPAPAPPPPMK